MNNTQIPTAMRRLKTAAKRWRVPIVSQIGESRDPFRVLASCLLSLRTRDEVTDAASGRLFALASTPRQVLTLKPETIQKAIYPVAFFRNKTATLRAICQELMEDHGGDVPDTLDGLLKLKGVGRKTANLTLIQGFGGQGICVDTHVHRICNRWGYVKTKTPDETEMALREKLPEKYWSQLNDLLVRFGQNCCKPISPLCSQCGVAEFCDRVGVKKSR